MNFKKGSHHSGANCLSKMTRFRSHESFLRNFKTTEALPFLSIEAAITSRQHCLLWLIPKFKESAFFFSSE